ncbi:MAG TPA: hypothetical protein VK816_01395 [Jatrophihabitantaceae bacterium]|nr:hypothetical protein [Jatrophihabitantaceae bacterium]
MASHSTVAGTAPVRVTTTAYTPAAGAAVGSGALTSEAVTVTSPSGPWTTTTSYNPAWGVETKVVDQNGNITSASYDAVGRRTGVWLPNSPQASYPNEPTVGYSYTVSTTAANIVTTMTEKPSDYELTYALYDGLGQQVQSQSPAEVNGTVISDTGYDAAGRVVLTNNPYWTTSAGTATKLFVPSSEAQAPSEVVTSFDGAGRSVASKLYSAGALQSTTATSFLGADRTDLTPPTGSTPTSTFTNSAGKTTKLVQYLSATPGTGTTETTTYGYSVQGQMTSMVDPALNLELGLRSRSGRPRPGSRAVC